MLEVPAPARLLSASPSQPSDWQHVSCWPLSPFVVACVARPATRMWAPPHTANGFRLPCLTGRTPHGPTCWSLRSRHRLALRQLSTKTTLPRTNQRLPRRLWSPPGRHPRLRTQRALLRCKARLSMRANLAGTAPPLVMTFPCQVSHVAIGSLVQLSTGLYRSLAGTKRLACSGPPGPKRTFSGQNTEAPAYRTIQPLDFRRARPYDGRWALFSASSLT